MYRIIFILACFLSACASQEPYSVKPIFHYQSSEFESYIDGYENLIGKKSLAIALSPNGNWAAGHSFDCKRQECADEMALLECNQSREKYNVDALCVIRVRGNDNLSTLRINRSDPDVVVQRLEVASRLGDTCIKKKRSDNLACEQFYVYLNEYFKQDSMAINGSLKSKLSPDQFINVAGLIISIGENIAKLM